MRTALGLALSLAASTAVAGPRASGTVGHGAFSVQVVDAYAYPAPAEFGDDEVIAVRLSTVPLDPAALDATLDREGLLDTQAAESPSIKLEFDKDGRWTGSSYYLASGAGCGYCSAPSAAGVAVKLEGGSLRGALLVKAADHGDDSGLLLDLKLDVPVAPAAKATALGPGGGEPGKAFMACQQATARKDAAAFRAACGILEQELDYAERENSLDSFWDWGIAGHAALKLANVKVTGGRATENEAELLLTATDADGAKQKAVVRLGRTPEGWRYRKAEVEAVYE